MSQLLEYCDLLNDTMSTTKISTQRMIRTYDAMRQPGKDCRESGTNMFKCNILSNTSPLGTKDIHELILERIKAILRRTTDYLLNASHFTKSPSHTCTCKVCFIYFKTLVKKTEKPTLNRYLCIRV
jgi:hypothetical protein